MVAKRRARRPRSGDSKESGRNGGNEGSDDCAEEESGKSGEDAIPTEPKEMPLKRAVERSPPSPADAGAQVSSARTSRRGGVTMKTKATTKRVKKPPSASQEEDEAEDSSDASPTRGPLPDDTAVAGHNKSAVTPKRGKKRSTPPRQEEERLGKRAMGPDGDGETVAASGPDGSETEKKQAVGRSWSYDDELKILNALVEHAQSHNGALPESSHLLANLTFDKIDANEDKLTDKIRKLRTWYCRFLSQGCPSDDLSRQLFKLSEILWCQVGEDEWVEPTSRDFSVLSKLYPHLAKEVKAYTETHNTGDLIMAMFMTIGDEMARDLDAKCKNQQMEALKLELGQASLTKELLSALSSLTSVKF